MNRGGSSDSIPTDLVYEILSRLPAKSIGRFRCVSKLWKSMLCRQDFTDFFLTRSSARPRLLFGVHRYGKWSFFSSPQSQNMYGKPLVVAAEFHMKFFEDMWPEFRSLTSGLIYFPSMTSSKKGDETVPVICNPITGQYASLPLLSRESYSFLGFDPIYKQFKVLSMTYPWYDDDHKILTVGTGEMSWRKIQCPLKHDFYSEGICINGFLYYLADLIAETSNVIVCFDVRSEKFKFIDRGFTYDLSTKLINYKGKLGAATWKYAGNSIELCLRVLEDEEKQEWSKCVYTLPENAVINRCKFSVFGITTSGEIVLSMEHTYRSSPFYVFYFNPKRNTLQSVEIQGLENESRIYPFVDHVEDLNVNDAKYLNSSKGLNIITKRPKPQHREEIIETDRDRRYDDGISSEKKQCRRDLSNSEEQAHPTSLLTSSNY